jgi:hypothetical protein
MVVTLFNFTPEAIAHWTRPVLLGIIAAARQMLRASQERVPVIYLIKITTVAQPMQEQY